MRPDSPVVWSKCPWLQTIASMPAGSWPRRRRLPAHPSGVIPVSNSSRRTRLPLRTSTSAENPCWASGTSAALPPSIVGASSIGARAIPASGSRFAGPWSGSSMSMTLSQMISTDSSSTGSSGRISPVHSKLAGNDSAVMTSARSSVSHMAAPPGLHRRITIAGRVTIGTPPRKLVPAQRGAAAAPRAEGPPAVRARGRGAHPARGGPAVTPVRAGCGRASKRRRR